VAVISGVRDDDSLVEKTFNGTDWSLVQDANININKIKRNFNILIIVHIREKTCLDYTETYLSRLDLKLEKVRVKLYVILTTTTDRGRTIK
jgi:hypothetical protein